MVQRALLGLVREALRIVSNEGLPGEHHFVLAFRTDAPGVVVPARLRAQYPQEMSIVVQHVFRDLAVDDDRFSVTLRFGGAAEHLVVPFAALVAFVDPSAHFGLRFDGGAVAPDEAADQEQPAAPAPLAAGPRPAGRPAPALARPEPARPRPTLAPSPRPAGTRQAARKPAPGGPRPTPVPAPAPAGKKVVDLAAFRKAADKPEDA